MIQLEPGHRRAAALGRARHANPVVRDRAAHAADVLEGRRRQLLRPQRRGDRDRARTTSCSRRRRRRLLRARRCRRTRTRRATSKAHAPPELVPAIPDVVRRDAAITLRKLGVDPNMDLGVSFNKLVGCFRAFQAGDIKHPTGDVYRDLCDSQAGVCRHRSFAFMITANALGIPTRLRRERGARVRRGVVPRARLAAHRPRRRRAAHGRDRRERTRRCTGLAPRTRSPSPPSTSRATPSSRATSAASRTSRSRTSAGPSTTLRRAVPRAARSAPGPARPTGSRPTRRCRPCSPTRRSRRRSSSSPRPPRARIEATSIHVEGVVRTGKPLADHVVYVYLSPAGENGAHPVPIGSVKTGADGTFRADLPLPPQLDLSTYEI